MNKYVYVSGECTYYTQLNEHLHKTRDQASETDSTQLRRETKQASVRAAM